MLYRDFDITLFGTHVRVTPMLSKDEECYARLMFGDMYNRYIQLVGRPPNTGLDKVLSHESEDEAHAIRLLDDPMFIGWITLQRDEEGKPDIGIHLSPEFQNKGFGPEAIELFANNLYREYGMSQVFIRTTEGNLQAQRAFEKLGAELDDIRPDTMMKEINARLPQEDKGKDILIRHYRLNLPL